MDVNHLTYYGLGRDLNDEAACAVFWHRPSSYLATLSYASVYPVINMSVIDPVNI